MKLSLDISKPAFEKLGNISGLYSLRLDYGFTEEDIVKLSNEAEYFVELNASTLTNARFEKLVEKGLNLQKTRLSFNYYPKVITDKLDSFEITKYEEEINMPTEQKILDMISLVSLLPFKTRPVNSSTIKISPSLTM